MADTDRLRFALSHLRQVDWEAFEDFCGAWLAGSFPDLRRLGGVGDKGRDAVFAAHDMDDVIVQISIQANWNSKIRATITRLRAAEITCKSLVYMTNHEIGPKADDLKADLLSEGVSLDVRDSTYFLDRIDLSPANRAAAASLCERVLDPLLPTNELTKNSPIGDRDLRAGLVYLELQTHDSSDSRNLTRLSYDSLVLGTLKDTDPDNRRSHDDIAAVIQKQLPTHDGQRIQTSVEGSLKRLKSDKKIVVTGGTPKTYALHHNQRTKQADRAIEILAERDQVRKELAELLARICEELEIGVPANVGPFVDALDAMLQLVLEQQGHGFAEAVREERGAMRRADLLQPAEDTVTTRYKTLKQAVPVRDELVELLLEAGEQAFVSPSNSIQAYLRELSDAYTLLAFMHEAPDVQRAVSHFFSRGLLVLDTSALLPCFAESQLEVGAQRFTNLLRSAVDAGMELATTIGVVNEIDTHLQRALHCARTDPSQWIGEVPFALAHWQEIVGTGDFTKHVERFRGTRGPEDIQVFLEHGLRVSTVDLERAAESALGDEDRFRLTELWRERKKVRSGGSEADRDLLLRHDVEMYLGVLAYRKSEKPDVYGYETWWVTQDRTATALFKTAKAEGLQLKSNPCMSPAFLSNLISLGPARTKLGQLREQLPIVLDIQRRGWGAMQLSHLADEIREKHADEPEWLIRRRIRDAMIELKEGLDDATGFESPASP
jgi:hypothetical protein